MSLMQVAMSVIIAVFILGALIYQGWTKIVCNQQVMLELFGLQVCERHQASGNDKLTAFHQEVRLESLSFHYGDTGPWFSMNSIYL